MQVSEENNRTINSGSAIQLSPTNFIYSGYGTYNASGVGSRGSAGRYWQLAFGDGVTDARGLVFDSTTLRPRYSGSKGLGFSLRCLVR